MLDLAIDSRVFLTSELDAALQELDILFNTENTELIGHPEFGTNFEQFLWDMNPSASRVEEYIKEHIKDTFFLSTMQYSVAVKLLNGEYRGVYHVIIEIYDEQTGTSGERQYQFR